LIGDTIYKSGRFLIPALILWFIAGTGIALIYSILSAMPVLLSSLMILPPITVNIILSISGRFLCRFFPPTWANFYKLLIVQCTFCLLSSMVWFFIWFTYVIIIQTLAPTLLIFDHFYRSIPIALTMVVLIHIIFILIHYIILYIERNRLATEELLRQKLHVAETELKALKNTIHPHFLFNSLSMLQGMIQQAPEKASTALASLSEYLLYSIQFSKKTQVTLEEEIVHARNYCEIEHLRRNKSFEITWNLDMQCNNMIIIPFILQPLIENAIKHGIDSSENGGFIKVDIFKTENTILLSVKNSVGALPLQTRKSGTGLEILSRRVATTFGDRSSFIINNESDSFCVTITIPIKKE
jgi:sensor histidine kinase YesM